MTASLPRVALLTNIPTPYRDPVYALLPRERFQVIFCADREPNRSWETGTLKYPHLFLKRRQWARKDGFNFVYNNPDVWGALRKMRPNVVITTGFSPTYLYAFVWAKMHGAGHVCMTDGTATSERNLTWAHRTTRKFIFKHSDAFVAASRGGIDLYQGYGVPSSEIFLSRLCANNDAFFEASKSSTRIYDVMFAGQFHERKLPFFFVAVCKGLLATGRKVRALLIGDGPLRDDVLAELREAGVDYDYPGFVQPKDLPNWYARSKLLLFTTRLDAWGVVANEAMAAGTPVIATPDAGVAHDLVIDRVNGRVLPADVPSWTEAVKELLEDECYWASFSLASQRHVSEFTYQSSAQGIEAAVDRALARH